MKKNHHWKLPKNIKEYFSPKREKELKSKYGGWYTLHTILSVIILIVPFLAFMFLSPDNALTPQTQSGNLLGAIGGILGLVGSFSIGIGLVNVFSALLKQYLGHFVTLSSILLGIGLDLLALFLFALVK